MAEFPSLNMSRVVIGRAFEQELRSLIDKGSYSSVFVVADRRFKSKVESFIKKIDAPSRVFYVPGAEKSKRLKSFQDLISTMIEAGADRKSLVVAIGGGVVGDLAGFSASVYMRGVPWISVPTTLLGMVDSGYGGKTAINHPKMKNSIGSFHMPLVTIVDVQFLKTLAKRDLISGAGELLKYGLLSSSQFYRELEPKRILKWSKKPALALNHIKRCLALKAKIVKEDFTETTGKRAILNLGHTGAHAFETVTGYDVYRHGEAVILGLEMCIRISRIRGLLGKSKHDLMISHLRQFEVPTPKKSLPYQDLWHAMKRDKKSESGRVRMVLLSDFGRPMIGQEVSSSDVMLALIEMAEEGLLSLH